ncbi:low temperature requirement protein A [Tsuneonella flava]|uniref:Low temperature requirement protein A n=1 Tax=Tsuneonella flava TaxID=2055955 RepID=A0ABX7K9C2_9SPHN|nr:low temperature requirement protein A [Tsuneonella flava]QSB44584.1 low temperature requirement protein A [Tsuneonella flava]
MSEVKGRLFDYRPFGPRDPHETHRAATPLELFFDLVTVIAIASAAVGLHHGIAEGHTMQALPVFMVAFFGIWWAWMNYTWFASAYDNDGPIYRLLTFWIMFGFLWLIAARNDPSHATTAHRYAAGIAVAQVLWVALAWLLVPGTAVFFAVLALAAVTELMVPVYAERAGMTPWHDDHIVERYGLLMIILLGEILLAGSASLAKGGEEIGLTSPLLHVALASLVIAFAMWWLYFSRDDHLRVHTEHEGLHFQWGYGHLIPFAATAAVGAGFGVLVDIVTGHAHIPLRAGDIAVALPLALYMAGLWFVRDRFVLDGGARAVLPVFAVLVLIAGALMPAALESMAVLSVLAVFVRSVMATRARRRIRAES